MHFSVKANGIGQKLNFMKAKILQDVAGRIESYLLSVYLRQ